MSACRFCAQLATFCVVSGDMSRHVSVMSQTQENVVSARVSKRHDIWRHVGKFPTCRIVVWVQTQKLYGRVANSYVWADLYLSAVIDINWVCRGLFCVATTCNVGQDLVTFGDVGDMSATRRRHVELRWWCSYSFCCHCLSCDDENQMLINLLNFAESN